MDTQVTNLPVVAKTEAKSLYDNAKESLNLWETAINKTTATLDKLNSGDSHLSVYQALRDVVMFSVWCMDNLKDAASTFKEWAEHEPARADTNPYRQPVDLIFDRAGVQLESIACKCTEWAAIARYVHPMVKAGKIDEASFISFIEASGGIRATYDSIPKDGTKGRKPKGGGKGGLTSGGADKVFQANFDKLKQPRYVVAVFDLSQSNAYKDADSLGNFLGRMNEYVSARDGTVDDLVDDGADDLVDMEGVQDEAA